MVRRPLRLQAFLLAFAVVALNAATAHAYIYWSSNGPNDLHQGTTLNRADLDGTGVDRSFVTDASGPIAMQIESGKLYWLNVSGYVGTVNISGSDPDPTVFAASSADLAVDQDHVYWIDALQYVGRASLDGSNPQPHFINLGDSSTIDAIGTSGGTLYLAVDNGTTMRIQAVPVTGGAPSTLATLSTDSVTPTSFAIAGGYLYFTLITNFVENAGTIGRVPLSGGTADESFIPDAGLSYGVATDGTYVYWTDFAAGTIGRALIGSEGATDIESSFMTDPNGPWGIAVDGGIDATSTTVACLHPTVVPGATVPCTATVHDTASTTAPAGAVDFAAGATLVGNPCTLGIVGGVAQCTVTVAPAAAARLTVSATYGGDAIHESSSGTAALCAGTTTQCGGAPPPPKPTPACQVPKLKGKTLGQAGAALAKAHCKLGKVTKPKHGHKFVVSSTKPPAGKKLTNGAKVAVKLVAAPKGRSRR